MKKKPIYLLNSICIALMLITLVGCYDLTTRNINELHVVPEGYEGWLIIHYECEGGKTLVVEDETVKIEYDENGYYCTSDELSASYGQVNAIDRDGNLIPVYPLPSGNHEYAMCCGSSRSISKGIGENAENWVLGLFWIGYMDTEVQNEEMLNQLLDIDIQK